MPKRVKKVVNSAKSKSFQSKNISLPHKLWLSAGIGAVILILAVMFLFPYLQGKVTGEAGFQGPAGFYWETLPEDGKSADSLSKCTEEFPYFVTTKKFPSGENTGCCITSNNFCIGGDPPPLPDYSGYTCYTENSIVYETSEHLCIDNNGDNSLDWVKCTNNQQGIYETNPFFLCSGSWSPCLKEEVKSQKYYCDESSSVWQKCGNDNIELKGDYLCDGNSWEKCNGKNPFLPFIPSEYNYYYCDGLNWMECNSGNKDKVTEDKKYACLPDQWELCNGLYEGEITSDKVYGCFDNKWQMCDQSKEGKLVADDKLICSNSIWDKCDSSNFWAVSSDSQYWCGSGDKWTNFFTLIENSFYEVDLVKGKGLKYIGSDILIYNKIALCDKETDSFAKKATLCYEDNSKNEILIEVASNENLYSSGTQKPYEENGLLFIYEEPLVGESKTVSVILLKDLTNAPIHLSSGSFAKNLLDGRRLALKIPTGENNYEYYLLSHEESDLFKEEKLKLTHIPLQTEFTPTHIPENNYQFTVLADKAITIHQQSGEMVISVDNPGEAPAAYPLPFDLGNNYEVPFSATEPVKLTDLGNTLLTVCTTGDFQDNPGDTSILLICENDQPKLTLNLSQLTEAEIQGQKVALLFEIATEADGSQKKQAYLFWREELSNTINSPLNLDYNDLINNFVAGRRIAFSFGESVYLAKHPVSQFISLPSLELDTYTESGKAIYPASGSEKKVGFLIPEGKIILERDFSTPPPPFKVSALTKQQIIDTPVDLEKQLFASMSNQIPVKITAPDFGIISVNTQDDISADKDLFKISTEIKNPPSDFILKYGVPKVIENTLFYYFSASIDAGEFVKAVKIYRLYSLSIFGLSKPADNQHAFNDEFIKIFTAGNELAFRFDNSYYLLGYKGATEGTKAFFSLSDLTLRALNGSAEYGVSADLEAQTATFEVPEGNVVIEKDGVHNLLKFSATTKDILTLAEFEEYSMLLTSENKIKINEVTYKICDNQNTEISDKIVLFCYGNEQKLLALDTPITLNGKLFWYQGKTNGLKNIKVYSIEGITDEPINYPTWGDLQKKVAEGKSPAFSWQKQYFELTGTQNLNTFALQTIPDGEIYPIQNIQSSFEDLQNGTFEYHSNLLQALQEWTDGFNIQLTLTPLDYLLVTEEGFNVSADQKDVLFTPSLDAPIYHVEIIHPSYPELTVIKLEEKGQIFAFYLLPPGKIQAVLLPNGEVIEIEAIDTKTITLKK